MKPKKLRVKNFAGYYEETFDFEVAPDLFAVIGHNGAGKSTFFVDAITICLFNQGRSSDARGSGLEKLIKLGQDFFEIEFNFEINEQNIRVIRRRFEKAQELELFIDDVDHTEKIKETQDKILKILKMDYDTFLDTACIGQSKSGRFMEKKPDERKEVFTKVLGLDRFDILEKETAELRKDAKKQLEKLQDKLNELQGSVNNKEKYENEIETSESEISTLEFEIEQHESELEKELSEKALHDQTIKSVNDVLNKRKNLKSQIDQIENSISQGEERREKLLKTLSSKDSITNELESTNKLIDELQDRQTTLLNEKSSLNAKIEFLTSQAKERKTKHTRLKDFNDAECEFCGQPITEDHKTKHLQQLAVEGKNFINQINAHKDEIESIDTQLNSIRSKLSNTKLELRNLMDSKTGIDQAEAKLPGIENRLEELKNDLEQFKSDYEENLKVKVENVENRTFKDVTIKSELANLRNSLSNHRTRIGIAKNELKKIEEDVKSVSKIEKEMKETKKLLVDYDELVKAWGKKGIQAVIIDNALGDIQDEINKFLDILSDGKSSIEFRTQKENGKHASVETLDIIITDDEGSRAYETYSGGEKFRVDFACHIGLAKFLSKRAGSPIEFFILDEGVGSQDEAAKEQFLIAVNKLTTIFGKVIVITHIPDIIEAFNEKVEVYKDPVQGSKIKLIG